MRLRRLRGPSPASAAGGAQEPMPVTADRNHLPAHGRCPAAPAGTRAHPPAHSPKGHPEPRQQRQAPDRGAQRTLGATSAPGPTPHPRPWPSHSHAGRTVSLCPRFLGGVLVEWAERRTPGSLCQLLLTERSFLLRLVPPTGQAVRALPGHRGPQGDRGKHRSGRSGLRPRAQWVSDPRGRRSPPPCPWVPPEPGRADRAVG